MAEITVNNFQQLKDAIRDTTSTVIHLGGPITFSSGGIVVPKTKGDILVDGHGYTVNDWNGGLDDTIHFDGTIGPAVTFTVQNTVWNGKNWYGIIYTYETAYNSNITTVINNVQYVGPQPVHNRFGITRVIDSSFNVTQNGSINPANEFAEANRLTFEGNVTINSEAISTAIVYFMFTGSTFTVEENAILNITAVNYFLYSDAAGNPVMRLKKNSSTNIQTRYGLFYDTGNNTHIASSFTLESGASFKHSQLERRTTIVQSFKCRDSFVLEPGSTFHLFMPSKGTSPLMYFGNKSTISFNDPKSVILYNNGGNVFAFESTGNTISIYAELVNRWGNARTPVSEAGGFNDPPSVAFAKVGGSNINASITTTTNAISTLSSNIENSDKGYPMNSSSFNIFQSQVISMGNLKIILNEINDVTPVITGITEPSANIRSIYDSITKYGNAEKDGTIKLELDQPLTVGTEFNFASNWNFLTKEILSIVVGSLTITYLPDLSFNCFAVPFRKDTVKRSDPNWYLEVTDTRTSGEDWYLYVSLPSPMSSNGDTLDDVLTINQNMSSQIISETPILIKQEKWIELPGITRITWPEIEGFLLKIIPDFDYNPGKYSGQMTWILRDSPFENNPINNVYNI